MSNFRYDNHHCQKQKERKQDTRHRVHHPQHYITQVTEHEKCMENLSNVKLRQGSRPPSSSKLCSSSEKGEPLWPKKESKSSHGKSPALRSTAATSQKSATAGPSSDLCYPVPRKVASSAHRCKDAFVWQAGKYVRDDCGSGIVPSRLDASEPKRLWCNTPLTMYQSTIGELARKMLCNEVVIRKRVNVGPPCNLCEHVMPLCRGYYRKYQCRRSCEEEHAVVKDGKKVYRDAVQQYWMPCLTSEQKREYDLSKDADHNVYLGKKLKRRIGDKVICW